MLLFLRNIPLGCTRDELKRFVRQTIRNGWLARLLYHPRVEKTDILKMKARDSSQWEFHGLVRISPSSAGPMVMQLLRESTLRGHKLHVQSYRSRRIHDRRRAYTDPRLLGFDDRRVAQRRRDLKLTTLRPVLQSQTRIGPGKGYEFRLRKRRPPTR
jgi:hypothetical protein